MRFLILQGGAVLVESVASESARIAYYAARAAVRALAHAVGFEPVERIEPSAGGCMIARGFYTARIG